MRKKDEKSLLAALAALQDIAKDVAQKAPELVVETVTQIADETLKGTYSTYPSTEGRHAIYCYYRAFLMMLRAAYLGEGLDMGKYEEEILAHKVMLSKKPDISLN